MAVTSDTPASDAAAISIDSAAADDISPKPSRSFKVWLTIVSLSITLLLVTMEMTIISTALPTIAQDIRSGNGSGFIWVPTSYNIAITSLQPVFGQLADVFGRRSPLYLSIGLFILGSGLCGGAIDLAMLVAGRTIQGIGGAGVNVLVQTIICDLIPLKERGSIMGLVMAFSAVGAGMGPIIGGAIVQVTTWRWVFYLNLPLAGFGLALLLATYRPTFQRTGSVADGLARLDWAGNALFVTACSLTVIGISWAGSEYAWSSPQVVAPLVLGLVGLVGFFWLEASPLAGSDPMMPLRLFGNRTSIVVMIMSFIHGILTAATGYYLPLYFQAVLLSSPGRTGVQLLPGSLVRTPFGIVGGVLLSKWGNYRALHALSFALMAVGLGLFALLNEQSSTAEWVCYQLVENIGIGLLLAILMPIIQATLDESDTARVTAAWSFVRSFGLVWGIVMPGVVFNNRFAQLAHERVQDVAIVEELGNGNALGSATRDYIIALSEGVRDQVVGVYRDSLKFTWLVLIAFAAIGLVMVPVEKAVELRTNLKNEHGIAAQNSDQEESGVKIEKEQVVESSVDSSKGV